MSLETITTSFTGIINSYIKCKCHILYVILCKEVIYRYLVLKYAISFLRVVVSVVSTAVSHAVVIYNMLYSIKRLFIDT